VSELFLSLLLQLPEWVQIIILILILFVFPAISSASAWCAAVPTPPPNTPWGKIYRGIEYAGFLIGKAKQVGVPAPTMAEVQAAFAEAARESAATGKPIDVAKIALAAGVRL
jgi:hypothetical protein